METYFSEIGDRVVIRGGRFEAEDLIRIARNHEITDWTITYKVAPEHVKRKAILFSNVGKRVVSWVEYRNIIQNWDGSTFIFDSIRDRFYLPGEKPKSSLDSPLIRHILMRLAQNPHGQTALEISEDFDFDHRDGPAAIRQAIRRIRQMVPDLIITERIGYRLNPDSFWLIIKETGA